MWALKINNMYLECIMQPIYGSFFTCFSYVFLILNYWNFDIGVFVLKSSISVQVIKKIFGTINKRGVQITPLTSRSCTLRLGLKLPIKVESLHNLQLIRHSVHPDPPFLLDRGGWTSYRLGKKEGGLIPRCTLCQVKSQN